MIIRIPVYALLILILTACNSLPKGPEFSEAPKPPESNDLATIYLMRFSTSAVTSPNSVKINGKEIVALPQGYYSWVQLPEGEYTLSESTPWYHADISGQNANSSKVTVKVENGKTYYFGFSEDLVSMSSGVGIMYAGGVPIAYPESSAKYKRYWNSGSEKEGKAALKYMVYIESAAN